MTWTNILCEAVCFYDVSTQKFNKSAPLEDLDENFKLKKGSKWKVEKNKNYISPKLRPKWCIKYNKKRNPQFYCLGPVGGMKCPFILISNCCKEEYEFMHHGLSLLEKKMRNEKDSSLAPSARNKIKVKDKDTRYIK